jgi:hypothetical protein
MIRAMSLRMRWRSTTSMPAGKVREGTLCCDRHDVSRSHTNRCIGASSKDQTFSSIFNFGGKENKWGFNYRRSNAEASCKEFRFHGFFAPTSSQQEVGRLNAPPFRF